ncbi:site-specific integrase [Salipiger manganoxidans]|uniref:tyrosine-type recombinase/integrase n=1 Tax=Salipiger marinus TaxID=555512 RepID=UPI001E2E1772|nr:site-specific integrase [Salipiger manganoxidans]MCD1620823.1 site-specific integrase [Salipiger manganoxidans]
MASIQKHGKKWRAFVAREGIRTSKVFPTRQEARDWAAREEYTILHREEIASATLLSAVLERYGEEVSTEKRGERWEQIRLAKIGREDFAKKAISDVTATDIAEWRDKRLREVSASSVRREMNLLSSVFSVAMREWRMISKSPMPDVRKPKEAQRRERRPTSAEMERLALSAGADLSMATARAYHAFLFSIETGMRAGEVVGLTAADVDVSRRVARLPRTKNGTAREVPLSGEAVRLLQALPESDPLFGLDSAQLDALWRKLRDRAGVENLHFHDSRHEAITRLSRKLDVLALARMVGHRDIKMLLRYYDETAEDLAKRLD